MTRLLGLLLLAVLSLPASAEWSIRDMNRTIDQTNFLVNDKCSGTLVNAAAQYILTAAHCVDSQYETAERETVAPDGKITTEKYRRMIDGKVTQLTFNGVEKDVRTDYRVKLVAVDTSKDLAVVQVIGALPVGLTATVLATVDPERGDKVYIVGNPMVMLYASVVPGYVSSLNRSPSLLGIDHIKTPLLQISGGTIGGNSGGAVYNDKGELVGVPVLASRIHAILGFAVTVSAVREFLAANKLQ